MLDQRMSCSKRKVSKFIMKHETAMKDSKWTVDVGRHQNSTSEYPFSFSFKLNSYFSWSRSFKGMHSHISVNNLECCFYDFITLPGSGSVRDTNAILIKHYLLNVEDVDLFFDVSVTVNEWLQTFIKPSHVFVKWKISQRIKVRLCSVSICNAKTGESI